jgi:uroporphyrinogen-III synthase
LKIKSILVSQAKPESEKNPYVDLAKDLNVKIDFRSFIQVEGIPIQDFRKERIHIPDFTSAIFNSKNSVDHFFRIAGEARVSVPPTMKYFCMNEATALYLQKYIVYRKRKIFFGNGSLKNLIELMEKYRSEKFILPCSDVLQPNVIQLLEEGRFNFTKAVIYKTIASDLSDLANVDYDVLAFFSPEGIKSLFKNFPKFKQKETKIATFGPSTAKEAEEHGLRIDILVPTQEAPSMTMAIEKFVKSFNQKK